MFDIVNKLKEFDTTSVSDALDKLGLSGGLYGIKPVVKGTSLCGEAFTVHYVPCGEVRGTVGDFLDDVKEGQVVVIDNGGRDYCTVWGDIMTLTAIKKGIAGTLIDGVCRDIPAILEKEFPIFTKGTYMVTGKDRVEVDAVNEPVAVSGMKICPGDYILADDSGAVVIPRNRAEEVIRVAASIEETEQKIVEKVMKGISLREARAELNYHKLQTKAMSK